MTTPVITNRQRKVAECVAAGYANREIALELNLTEQIVKNEIHSLFDRFGVWNRVELANIFSADKPRLSVEAAQSRIENDRLAVLKSFDVLDTSAERAFDEITALAANIFQVPIALIVLLDSKRAWFKSNIGLDVSEVQREVTICQRTIRQSDVFVVENALDDARFSCISPVITDPKLRFYAAAPILTEDGYAVGVVCIVDRVPRKFPSEHLAILKSMARLALQQLEIRKQVLTLKSSLQPPHTPEAETRVVRLRDPNPPTAGVPPLDTFGG